MAKSKSAKKKSKARKSNDHPVTASSSSQPSVPQSSTSQLPSISSHNVSLDDMAMELLAAKETETEVKELRKEVARLKKEIEFKDAIIARLQAQSGTRTHTGEQETVSTSTPTPSFSSSTSKPAATDTVDHIQSKLAKMETLLHPNDASLPEPERKAVQEKLQKDEKSVKRIQSKGDLWEGIFKPLDLRISSTIMDVDDDVRRCPACGWEVINGVCEGCRTPYSDVEDSDETQENTDAESEPDVYDSNDSFINDDEDEDENDNNSNNNDSDSESDNGSQVSGQDTAKEIDGLEHSTLEASSGSESSESSDTAEEAVTEDGDSDDQEVKKPRRRISRRAIVVSDDEEDDKDKGHDSNVSASTATKAVYSKSSNKRSEESSDSDSSEDDDFVSAPKRRAKKPRSGNMEALFE
ncbi:hypothetical protein BG011_008884 [Mortierella polycephala]|uniref:Uncharacterized protein n=1 Tax=Mortierella polycephala TaxID=41804 RepID=A0A9P6Q9C8_9FUNG|nr:hypothetical protein BG011_008884 [Mortierella polycephala]